MLGLNQHFISALITGEDEEVLWSCTHCWGLSMRQSCGLAHGLGLHMLSEPFLPAWLSVLGGLTGGL